MVFRLVGRDIRFPTFPFGVDQKLTIANNKKQETSILFPAERATLANLITFLNGVEYFSIGNATTIHHDTQAHGIAEDKDWYYMGMF